MNRGMTTLNRSLFGIALLAFLFGWPGSRESRDFPRTTVVGERTFVTHNHLARHYDFPRSRPDEGVLVLQNDRHRLVLASDSRRAELNGVTVWLHEPVLEEGRRWLIPENDVRRVIDPVLRPERHVHELGRRVVLLDPGHGGRDEGGRGAMGTLEKEMTLIVSLRVAERLRDAGQRVYLTREDDRDVSLAERVAQATELEADLFVSIHFNTSANRDARGAETFVLPAAGYASTANVEQAPNPPTASGNAYDGANMVLGYLIQKHLLNATGTEDRGVRRARFHVLREAVSPAVLVECGFLTNPREERKIHRAEYREQLARAIADGILEYLGTALRTQLDDAL